MTMSHVSYVKDVNIVQVRKIQDGEGNHKKNRGDVVRVKEGGYE